MSDAPNPEENPIHQELAEQARRENKPPPSSSRFGTVAASRFPEAETLTERAAEIRKQDEGMIKSNEGSLYYKPVSVCGIELKLEPLQPSIGTIIHGIDLAEDVVGNADMVTFLRNLWLDRKVIMFREQNHLTPLQMKAFAMSFGDVQARFGEKGHRPNSAIRTNLLKIPEVPEMLVLISDENAPSAAANWHSDATWQKKPPMGSILLCREAPPIGGDTCFCNCYAMWEGLSAETRERLEQLTALHVGGYGHKMDGVTPSSLHPVARTHPETGRTLLYVQKGFVKRFGV